MPNAAWNLVVTALTSWVILHLIWSPATAEASQGKDSALGTLEGVITYEGEAPKSSITDDAGVRRQIIEVDVKTRGLRHVVVYFSRTNEPNRASEISKIPLEKPTVDQQDHEFTPRVIAVREGQTVIFSNSDPANHNVRTTASLKQNQFNVFTGIEGKYEHRFVAEPENRPIRLGCDIHPWMRGWIYVFDHPHFTVTDETGRFRLREIPPGIYQLQIVQPELRYREERKITIRPGEILRIESTLSNETKKN